MQKSALAPGLELDVVMAIRVAWTLCALSCGCAHVLSPSWRRCAREVLGQRRAAVCAAELSAGSLIRQSEVLELLSEVSDPTLVDLAGAGTADVVSLGLVREVRIETGSCSLELELPHEAIAAGAADRLRQQFVELLTSRLEWVDAVSLDVAERVAYVRGWSRALGHSQRSAP